MSLKLKLLPLCVSFALALRELCGLVVLLARKGSEGFAKGRKANCISTRPDKNLPDGRFWSKKAERPSLVSSPAPFSKAIDLLKAMKRFSGHAVDHQA